MSRAQVYRVGDVLGRMRIIDRKDCRDKDDKLYAVFRMECDCGGEFEYTVYNLTFKIKVCKSTGKVVQCSDCNRRDRQREKGKRGMNMSMATAFITGAPL